MKKIIDSKLYNTETAIALGEWCNDNYSNLDLCIETLYRTKKGSYFLHGEGGPRTEYSVQTGTQSWSGGQMIIPMTESDAKVWAEKKLTADEFIEIFGELMEA